MTSSMDLLSFLSDDHISSTSSIFCFVGNEYPTLFFPTLQHKIKQTFPLVTVLDSIDNEAALKAHLEITFLGTQTYYWLTEDFLVKNKNLLSSLVRYKGPNAIGFFTQKLSPELIEFATVIELPTHVDYELFITLFSYVYPEYAKKCALITKKIFNKHTTITLNSSYLLMNYCILVGNKSDIFIEEWLNTIVHPEKSLFNLSMYFFAKKPSQFFELWNTLSGDYSELFWTTYWSEQLFKAYAFITLSNAQNFIQAKRMAYRLPFSLIQKDWKSLTCTELKNAHEHLYTLDWNIKNGLSSNFTHFFVQFFLNKFN
jgi:hypothetical protein